VFGVSLSLAVYCNVVSSSLLLGHFFSRTQRISSSYLAKRTRNTAQAPIAHRPPRRSLRRTFLKQFTDTKSLQYTTVQYRYHLSREYTVLRTLPLKILGKRLVLSCYIPLCCHCSKRSTDDSSCHNTATVESNGWFDAERPPMSKILWSFLPCAESAENKKGERSTRKKC
jgi:hypothetical protein